MAAGPALAGVLIDGFGWSLPMVFWLSAALSIGTALLVTFGSREVRPSVVPEGRVLTLAFGGLLLRATWLQGVRAESLARLGQTQHRESVALPASRGTIFDRTGVELGLGERLATGQPSDALAAAATVVAIADEVAAAAKVRQDRELGELEEAFGTGRGTGALRKRLETRHRRELRRARFDAIREALADLLGAYRDLALLTGGAVPANGSRAPLVHPDKEGTFARLAQGMDATPRFYFAHSYYVACDEPEDVLATARYGEEFACAIGRGNIAGVQFHPEKSHRFGMAVLKNFAERF